MTRETDFVTRTITLELSDAQLEGFLLYSPRASGLVVFAHGSGSSRFSPRNRAVATALNNAGFATLLFDLLTAEEARVDQIKGELRFDIPLISHRLGEAVRWVKQQSELSQLPIGLFGASTGAAAALVAAAENPGLVRAVVSRGGRPDLASGALPNVKAPTLLIVGGRDPAVNELNRQAASQLVCHHTLEVVRGATHLFEEPGTLEIVQQLAADWFSRYLV